MPISQIVTNSIADDVTVKFADGSASTPSITATGDTNTGIFFPAADTIAFTEGGVEAMRINSSANVGIGTTSPEGKLDVASGNSFFTGLRLNGSNVTDTIYLATGDMGITTGSAAAMKFRTNSTERMRIDSSGNLLVGTSVGVAPGKVTIKIANGGNAIETNNTSGTGNYNAALFYNNGSTLVGYISIAGTTASYVSISDYRLKESIAPMTGALDKVQQLKPVTYKWKTDGTSGQGFIAHELQSVVPDCVTGEKDAVDEEGKPVYQGIDTSFLVATLTAAIQELKAEFDEYKRTHP